MPWAWSKVERTWSLEPARQGVSRMKRELATREWRTTGTEVTFDGPQAEARAPERRLRKSSQGVGPSREEGQGVVSGEQGP